MTPIPSDISITDPEFLRLLNKRLMELDEGRSSTAATAAAASGMRTGTRNQRLAMSAGSVPAGTWWYETDTAVYYAALPSGGAGRAWKFAAGERAGTISPDTRPTLTAADAGYRWRSTDTHQRFEWSGSAWTDITDEGGVTVQIARASGALTLTTAFADVPSVSVTLTRAGKYLCIGVCDMTAWLDGDTSQSLLGALVINGVVQTGAIAWQPSMLAPSLNIYRGTVAQQWTYTGSAGDVLKLQGRKTGGTGSSVVGGETSLTAIRLSA